jgi:pimeloyl-ACP methyl ester carboxylesterase
MHGFASSPFGRKITYLKAKLKTEKGIILHAPDLNVPSFAGLQLSAMIEKIAVVVDQVEDPVYLIGSSMGGLAALHFCDRFRDTIAKKISKIIFLAPAFSALSSYASQLDYWKQRGSLPIEHFHYGKTIDVHYGLIEDLEQYDTFAVSLDIPALIIHGRNDQTVPYRYSVDFAAEKPNVQLILVDDDHSLANSLDFIWQEVCAFFEI